MVASKVDILATIAFFISVMADLVDYFVLYLASYKSFSIRSFSPIKNLTIELMDFA